MPDLLLINPPLTLKERYGDLAAGGSALPPLGLANVAASVREAGFDVEILDAAILGLDIAETASRINSSSPRVVGITGATIAVRSMFALAKHIKENTPGTPIIFGGAHVSAAPEATMTRHGSLIDAMVVGEGEETAAELLRALLDGAPLENISGLALLRDGKTMFTAPRPINKDLDSLPFPARDLLPFIPDYYHPAENCYLRSPSTSVITSRGCAGRCSFCDRTVSGSRLRGHSAGRLIEVIESLIRDYGIRDIIMYDDNFAALRSRLHELCDMLRKRNNPVSWSCIARADTVGAEELKAMKKAGCWQIAYGVETGSQKILDSLNKGLSLEQVRKTLELTKRAGISSRGYFMIGVPGETVDTIKQTMRFMKKIPLDDFHMSFFTPWPASELYQRIKESGYYDDIDDHWGEMNGWGPTYVPVGLTALELERWHKKIFIAFYLRPHIVGRYILNSIRNPGLFPRMAKGGLAMMSALVKSYGKKSLNNGGRKNGGK